MGKIIKRLELKGARKTGASRFVFVALSVILELVILIYVPFFFNRYLTWIETVYRILAVIVVLVIYSQHKTSSMKMPWIILILMFPIPGIVLYVSIGLNGSPRRMALRYQKIDEEILPLLPVNKEVAEKFSKVDPEVYGVTNYLQRYAKYPIYQNTDVTYYDDCSNGLEAQLEALKKAENFIFMEYHAIDDKIAWKRIEDVLVDRVNAGVEVRVFYDDVGSIFFINTDFARKLNSKGIHCRVFNPVKLGVRLFVNNRDHRKITVVDGKVGFTGGYNLADEYFNITHPYGMWKDTGIRLEGDAVKSLTATFLEMWNAVDAKETYDKDYSKYLIDYEYKAKQSGFIQPYADNPVDNEHVGEEVYISLINKATKYCYFITPYLIITDEMDHALSLAAKRGVDVRIVTPGIPDKKMVYSLTRSFYNGLARNGVKIYEWTPGFCHCKMCVCDDEVATCGTINLDYRSLYHHFENGCMLYGCDAVTEIKADMLKTMEESRNVTEKYLNGRPVSLRLGQMFLRLFAELM